MSRFWRPGTEKPRLVDNEEGSVLFYSACLSSSSGSRGRGSPCTEAGWAEGGWKIVFMEPRCLAVQL
ncbi:hypothetical protein Pfo_025748 [Paulownia fortunei]|nr:hypothetical protein Pfo_025748 [Paulownia fortunei]